MQGTPTGTLAGMRCSTANLIIHKSMTYDASCDSDLGHHQLFKHCCALDLGVQRSVVGRAQRARRVPCSRSRPVAAGGMAHTPIRPPARVAATQTSFYVALLWRCPRPHTHSDAVAGPTRVDFRFRLFWGIRRAPERSVSSGKADIHHRRESPHLNSATERNLRSQIMRKSD